MDHETNRDAFAGEVFVCRVAAEVIYGIPCDPRFDMRLLTFASKDGWRILSTRRDNGLARLMMERLVNTTRLSKDREETAQAKYVFGLMQTVISELKDENPEKAGPQLTLNPIDDVEIEEGEEDVLAVITIPAKEVRIKIYDLGMEGEYV